ncbi:MAG: CapA family protein [Acetatifactor sp.]|nr:CapA family protein [Acetatifactor sp.]
MRKRLWKYGAPLVCCILLTGCSGAGNQVSAGTESLAAGMQADSRTEAEEQESRADEGGIEEESQAEPEVPEELSGAEEPDLSSEFEFTICFAGDINLDERWATTLFMDGQENGIYDCISPELIEYMNNADIMCLNNEFTYSTGGAPLEGKAYTFRADPERVEVLHQLGVDAVTLANNHIYDYGKEALLDTFAVLEEAEIPYFGAGRTLEEAMAPLYIEVDGKTVALVGASRAEKNKMTPQATETEPGILRCYDTELYRQAIAEAKANADFCIAFVHWGTEYSYVLEQVQLDTGKEYLDAGADAVIGAHSHCLQGLEYYDGKPIVYSLGNYWFNSKTLDTMLVQLHFSGNDEGSSLQVEIVPAVQSGCRTTYAAGEEERRRIFDFLESISVNVDITDEGIVREIP